VEFARTELAQRADVFTHDAIAWTLAVTGDPAGAARAMRLALAEGMKDARLFLHAGEIALARGEHAAASTYFAEAREIANSLTPSERALLARRTPSTDGVAVK